MPRPEDNTGDNHRAAIAALEEAVKRNRVQVTEKGEERERAMLAMNRAEAELKRLDADHASLQRGINALKAADQ